MTFEVFLVAFLSGVSGGIVGALLAILVPLLDRSLNAVTDRDNTSTEGSK